MKVTLLEKLIPISIGLLGFIFLIGIPPLITSNIAWLGKGDPLFNYVGWELFRYSPWSNPIGLNPRYGLDFNTSIVFSDSIPILAIFFKALSPLLNKPFQYFGIWLCVCFILQSLFAYKISSIFTKSIIIKSCASILILLIPAMLFRTNVHIALAGHFLLLWAIFLNLQDEKKLIQWFLLLFLSLGIHFYLFCMVLALCVANILDKTMFTSRQSLTKLFAYFIALAAFIYVCAWQFGYLVIPFGSSSDYGYGTMQANVLSILNPMGWSALITRDFYPSPNIESNNYLGLGAIGVIFLAPFMLLKSNLRESLVVHLRKHLFLSTAALIFFLLSISNNIELGKLTFNLPISDRILLYLNIVRCSGRFMWPVMYLVFFVGLWLLVKGVSFRILCPVLIFLTSLQIYDTSKGWLALYEHHKATQGSEIKNILSNNFWNEVPKKYSSIKFVPPQNWPSRWYTFAIYAAKHNLSTNSVFLARADFNKIQESRVAINTALKNGYLDDKTLYIFQEWRENLFQENPNIDSKVDLFARIDGFTLLAPKYKTCSTCEQVDSKYEISSLAPTVILGEKTFFNAGSTGTQLLLKGWGIPEKWGTWSIGGQSHIVIPTHGASPKSILVNAIGMVGPKHPKTNIEILVNGQTVMFVNIDRQTDNQILIPISSNFKKEKFITLEFKYLSPVSPKDAGFANQDERILTLGIESIILH
jgi:hypothetical protein